MDITDRSLECPDVACISKEILEHRRVDIARTDGIHADAFRAMVARHCPGEGVYCALGRAVSRKSRVGYEPIIGTEVRDGWIVRLSQQRKRIFRGHEGTCHIDREYAIPLRQARMLDRLLDFYPGGIHENVQLAAFALDLSHRRARIVLRCDVELHEATVICGL